MDNLYIKVNDINRPGIELAGYYNYFSKDRVQIIGRAEISFLFDMDKFDRILKLEEYFKHGVEFLIITRGMEYPNELFLLAIKYNVCILRTSLVTTSFINKIIVYLTDKFAPETRVHGVLMDVYGVGILIKGKSGVGKSETALELIKRGHRLVSDDAVDIKMVEGRLRGSSPFITEGLMEVRGIGIVDIRSLYGVSSIMQKKSISLVLELKHCEDDCEIDRLGLDYEFEDILGLMVRKIVLPVSAGRNIAVLIEAAAVNYRQSLISSETPVDIIRRRTMENMK